MTDSESFTTWHPAPTQRGTFGIFVTCLTTLGISLWSALHLNVPVERQSWQMSLARKVIWMLVGLLLPEYLIFVALCQYLSAKEVRDNVNKSFGFPTLDPWHMRLIRSRTAQPERARQQGTLGGTQNLTNTTYPAQKTSTKTVSVEGVDGSDEMAPRHHHRWTMAHGYYAVMGGFAVGQPSPTGFSTVYFLLGPNALSELLNKRPDLVADVPKEVIADKGKSDSLAKALLIVQVGWFCVNCVSRLIQGLPLTLLEVSTAAHALCALAVYLLWWDKPLNLTEPTIFLDIDIPISDRNRRHKSSYTQYSGISRLYRQLGHILLAEMDMTSGVYNRIVIIMVATLIAVGLFYGAPHLLAWNIGFPTHAEQILWRSCTLAVMLAPTFFILLFSLIFFLDTLLGIGLHGSISICSLVLNCLVYFPASLYLIVASLRQLFYLPTNAFEVPVWSNYFPHIS